VVGGLAQRFALPDGGWGGAVAEAVMAPRVIVQLEGARCVRARQRAMMRARASGCTVALHSGLPGSGACHAPETRQGGARLTEAVKTVTCGSAQVEATGAAEKAFWGACAGRRAGATTF
jgi:hypothetical protein